MANLVSSVIRFDSVTSTNDIAKEMAIRGEDEGVAILAREQTAGRGRHGRSWTSPAGEGLYLSIILRPEINPLDSPVLTLGAAVGVAETLNEEFNIAADIKWPNDVTVNRRKICGILVETAIEKGRLQYAIAGIGVNLNQREFPDQIRASATSLLLETGRPLEPDDFLRPLLNHFEHWYRVGVIEPARVIDRWQQLSTYARGRNVRIVSGDSMIEGVTRGLTPAGALLVELGNGEMREIMSGEVSLRDD